MEITSITPAIRIISENNMSGCEIYISFGDNIKITDIENRVFTGIFLYMDLSKNEEECDSIALEIGNENINIKCDDIKEIEEI